MMLEKATEYAEIYPTPFFLFDLRRIKDNYSNMKEAFPEASIHYAVKANDHPMVLSALREAGSKFEVGSWEEISLLRRLGVKPQDIIFSAPVKIPQHISRAYALGVNIYVFDSYDELEKLANLAPGVQVLVRLKVTDKDSLFPLNNKFGVPPAEAAELLYLASRLGLVPYGVAFHVGSQCLSADTWLDGLEKASKVWAATADLSLRCLNVGGGFPVVYSQPVISPESVANMIRERSACFPTEPDLMLEPGRIIVADAGVLVATVIGKAVRDGVNWLYLDVGALHGLLESLQSGLNIPYKIKLLTNHTPKAMKKYTVTGPTCDPDDTILKEAWVAEPQIGDRVLISDVGAYSTVYTTDFMGFSRPEIYFVIGRGGEERGIKQEYVGAGRRGETA
jgi:ornithine decarboxylase